MATEPLSAVALASVVRLDAVAMRLGAATIDAPVPALQLTADLASPTAGAPLIDDAVTGLRIGSAQLGASVSAAGVAPLATFLDATPGTGVAPKTVDVAQALESSLELQRLGTLMGALFALLSAQTTSSHNGGGPSPLQAALDVLGALSLAGPAQDDGTGIVTSSWTALLADPAQYASSRLAAVLGDPASAAELPRRRRGVRGVHGAAARTRRPRGDDRRRRARPRRAVGGRAGAVAAGDRRRAARPARRAARRATALFADPAAVKALVGGLTVFETGAPLPLPLPGLTVSVDAGAAVTVATAGTALGGELSLSGAVTFDVTGTAIAGQLLLASPAAGIAAALSASVHAVRVAHLGARADGPRPAHAGAVRAGPADRKRRRDGSRGGHRWSPRWRSRRSRRRC